MSQFRMVSADIYRSDRWDGKKKGLNRNVLFARVFRAVWPIPRYVQD